MGVVLSSADFQDFKVSNVAPFPVWIDALLFHSVLFALCLSVKSV